MDVMTPEEFAERMRELIVKNTHPIEFLGDDVPYFDPEDCHPEMDELLCKVLKQLGYGEGVDIFKNTKKWYA